MKTIEQLQMENAKLRKIAAHVPPRIYIAAKEQAGFGTAIVTDWMVQDAETVDPTEAKLVRIINGIKSLRRYVLVEGYPTTHDHTKLIGFAYDASSWGFSADPSYEPYEALEKCEAWLHGELDKLLNIVNEPIKKGQTE